MKKILMSLATVGALSALITGASFALFTAQTENQNNTFTAGTVRLGSVTGFTCGVNANNMAPGDSGSCTVKVTYTGSLEAWIGVDYEAEGDLFEGDNPMTISLSGGNGATVDGIYVLGKYSDGQEATVTVSYDFPAEAGNAYQEAEGEIELSFVAVQARNNTNDAGNGPISWN